MNLQKDGETESHEGKSQTSLQIQTCWAEQPNPPIGDILYTAKKIL
jgi:hypothetical protein